MVNGSNQPLLARELVADLDQQVDLGRTGVFLFLGSCMLVVRLDDQEAHERHDHELDEAVMTAPISNRESPTSMPIESKFGFPKIAAIRFRITPSTIAVITGAKKVARTTAMARVDEVAAVDEVLEFLKH